jgi:predicted RNA-binding Zn ribbon-like protein
MPELGTNSSNLNLIGGRVCLDFTNTIGGERQARSQEYLNNYCDLVLWGQHAGAVTAEQAQHLLAEASRRPEEAAGVLREAIRLREAIYRILRAWTVRQPPSPEDVTILNQALANALTRLQVEFSGESFGWGWQAQPEALDAMLWPVIRSAAELLTSEDLKRVRVCEGETCGWLFLDLSRNQSRRWCTMNDCGNRAKAKRHYQRHRQAGPSTS